MGAGWGVGEASSRHRVSGAVTLVTPPPTHPVATPCTLPHHPPRPSLPAQTFNTTKRTTTSGPLPGHKCTATPHKRMGAFGVLRCTCGLEGGSTPPQNRNPRPSPHRTFKRRPPPPPTPTQNQNMPPPKNTSPRHHSPAGMHHNQSSPHFSPPPGSPPQPRYTQNTL